MPHGVVRRSGPTKLAPPRNPRVLARERLFRLLDRGRRRRVIWIEAPPGAGKTALLASWIASRRLRALWYLLDESDDLASLFGALAAALPVSARQREREIPSFRQEHLATPGAYSRRFFRAMSAHPRSPNLVVLDDYHHVAADSLIHRALADGLPDADGTTVVVASREGPPREMARLRASGALDEVPPAELVLSGREVRDLARLRAPGASPSAAALRAANGWAAGVVLVSLSGAARTDPEHAGRRNALEFLASEAFDPLGTAVRSILLATSVLPAVEPSVAQALTGDPHADRVLADLAHRGWFTDRLEGHRVAYRYHALFRELLLSQARGLLGVEGFVELAQRAAALLSTRGDADAALAVLAEAHAWNDLARELLARAPEILGAGRSEAFDRWLELLPLEVTRDEPWFDYWRGIARFPGDPGSAIESVQLAHVAFVAREDSAGAYRSWAAETDMRLEALQDVSPVRREIEELDALRARFPEFPDPATEAAVVGSAVNAFANVAPSDPRRTQWVERALALALSPGEERVRLGVGRQLAIDCMLSGDVIRSRIVVGALRPLAMDSRADVMDALVWHVCEAHLHAHAGEGETARAAARRGLELAERTGVHIWDGLLRTASIDGALAEDDIEAADVDVRALHETLSGAPRLYVGVFHYAASLVALRRGDAREACERARAAVRIAESAGHPVAVATGVVAWAAAAQRGGGTGPTIADAVRTAEAAGCGYAVLSGRLLGSLAALDRGEEEEASSLLATALAEMRRLGCMNSIVVSRADMAELCALALERSVEPDVARAIASVRRLMPAPRARRLPDWPWRVRVEALGELRVEHDRREPPLRKVQRKPLELLQQLVAHGERGAPLARLATALWPDADGDTAHHALETTIYRLRRLLGDPAAVVRRSGRASLDPDRVFVDAWAVESLAGRAEALHARGEVAEALRSAAAAAALYVEDLFPDEEHPALCAARSRLRERFERLARLRDGA